MSAEQVLGDGGDTVADVIERAWELGSRFDAWQEHDQHEAWQQAMGEVGLDWAFYTHRQRTVDEVFPWDHIDAAVRKSFLIQDYLMSHRQETRIDCRDQCFACGILPKFTRTRMQTPAEAWECPPVKPISERRKRTGLEDEVIPLLPS